MTSVDYPLGTIVELNIGKGVIRFSGPTSFKAGKWVGIELYEPKGKNNGSVDGVSYFTCPMNYGVFVRASQIKRALGNERISHQRTSSFNSPKNNSPRNNSPRNSPSPAKVSLKRRSISKPPDPVSPLRPSPELEPTPQPQPILEETPIPEHTAVVEEQPVPPPPTTTTQEQPAPNDHELMELASKVRVLESKRALDARTIRELEAKIAESQSFIALRPKLQAKLQSQQTELIAAKRDLADAQQLAELAEMRLLDVQEQLEVALLDKDVAEEALALKDTELEDLKEKFAEFEVELDVYRAEAALAEEEAEEGAVQSSPKKNAKDALAYIQLEKQNERLKEALIRLRDMTQENDLEQKRRIAEMEKDISGVDDLQSQYDSAVIKLANAEVQIQDLKLQLDDALGAEEMLVQLTERNLELGEKIEEMRITIEDLEALKELNDELEENHIETEKALNEDLEKKETEIRDHVRKIEILEDACADLEGTIEQFRDLVLKLQNELTDLRTQTQTFQTESQTAASQTAAILSQNLKLQSSVSKNQARQIEYELAKLDAREAKELVSIVQPYLPQVYLEGGDTLATNCYLFFSRLAQKVEIINSVVAEAHGLPKSLNSGTEVLVGITEMRGRLAGLSTLCRRFAAILRRCDVESFLNIGRLYPEVAPIEKRIDIHVDLLRRDEFREMECVSDVVKIQAQFDHLAETYFDSFDHDLGERELGYVVSFDLDLDIFAAAIGFVKSSVETAIQDSEVVLDMGGMEIQSAFLDPLESLLEGCKTAKALSRKLTKRLEDLTHESSALKSHIIPQMKTFSNAVQEPVNFAISLAQQVMPHISDARSGKSSFQLSMILSFVERVAKSTIGGSSWDAIRESILGLTNESGALLPLVMDSDNVLKVSGVSPWVTRINEIKASTAVNIEAERKLAQLNEEMQALARTLKSKDQIIQESGVKIELIERKLESSKKLADANTELQSEITKLRKEKVTYDEAMEQMQADLDTVEQEYAKLKASTAGLEKQASTTQPETETVPIEGNLETSYLLEQIEALRGSVRFLRTENSYLKGYDLLREIKELPPLLEPITRSPTPPLDPSGSSDTEDDDDGRPKTPPTLLSLATETKMLYRDVITFSSSPRVVDLSDLNAKRAEAKGGRVWMPKKKMPSNHVEERKKQAERLSRRVRGLMSRASAVGAI